MTDELLGRLWAAANDTSPQHVTGNELSRDYWVWTAPNWAVMDGVLPWPLINPNPSFSQQTYQSEADAYEAMGKVIRSAMAFADTTRRQLVEWTGKAVTPAAAG